MTQLLDHSAITVSSSNSPIDFEYEQRPPGALAIRHLSVQGQRAIEFGVRCDTCAFLFERISDSGQGLSTPALAQRLRDGVAELTPDLLDKAALLLPDGDYQVMLLELAPHGVSPGDTDDYFTHEQLTMWQIQDFGGVPHNPHMHYYRTAARAFGAGAALYEFAIPLIHPEQLDLVTLEAYQRQLSEGGQPTALAISVLDVKQPDRCDIKEWTRAHGAPPITQHWCLAHFLLDGHHKLEAAASSRAPLRLLSFLSIQHSVSTHEDIDRLIHALETGSNS
jgi:hypothetical protein